MIVISLLSASSEALDVHVDSPSVDIRLEDSEYDTAELQFDLRVKNIGKRAVRLVVGHPVILQVSSEENDHQLLIYETHRTFVEDGGKSELSKTHLLKPGASYVYQRVSDRVVISRRANGEFGLQYGSQYISLVLGFPPSGVKNAVTNFRTRAFELVIDRDPK